MSAASLGSSPLVSAAISCLVGANGLVPLCETPVHGVETRKDARPFVAVGAVEREAELRQRVGEAGLRIGNLAGSSIRDGHQRKSRPGTRRQGVFVIVD